MSPRIAKFDWDDANVEHIARHEVVPKEVEEAFLDPFAIIKEHGIRFGEMRYSMLGRTAEDRLLMIAYTIRRGAIRTVTAYTARRKDRNTFQAGR